MPSTVAHIFDSAGLTPSGPVNWGEPVPETRPGVYVVALTPDAKSIAGASPDCPIDPAAVVELLHSRPELKFEGARPTEAELADRLNALWLGDEVIVYIGLAGTSVQARVNAYYRTPLGARSPHAGGWPLKTLSVMPALWVYYSASPDPAAAEQQMLDAFVSRVSAGTRAGLHDPTMPLPFANLEHAKGQRKQHGITGARAPRTRHAETTSSTGQVGQAPEGVSISEPRSTRPGPPACASAMSTPAGPMRSQRITEKDIQAGRIRFPSSAKPAFPIERTELEITLRGTQLTACWHPHYDYDQERSGVLSVGYERLNQLVRPHEVLSVGTADGRVFLA